MRFTTRVAAMLLVTALSIAGQSVGDTGSNAGRPPTAVDPTIRVTTRLVQVSVVVHDRHGNPVADLTKDSFSLTDQGKPQTLSLFSVDTVSASASSPTAVQTVATVMPSNQMSNRVDRQANVPTSVTVILFDLGNTKLADQMYAKQQIQKFLRQIRPEDRIAIYTLNGTRFRVVQDFTNNSEALLSGLARVRPGFSHQLDGSTPEASNTGDNDLDNVLDNANAASANFFIRNRAINTALSMKSLAYHLSGMTGRKNLVWVSAGFPIAIGFGDPQDTYDPGSGTSGISHSGALGIDSELLTSYIEEASRAMNTANVAVYPVDARGLIGLPIADASKNFKIDSRTHRLPDSASHVDTREMDTMRYIADLTGGKAFINTNDIEGAIRKSIDDSSVAYTLGYYVAEDNWDNKFHKIKVKVSGSGLSVRTKKGYFAEEQTLPNKVQLERATHDAVWSPLDSTELGVTAQIDPSPALPNATRVTLRLNLAEFRLKPENDRMKGDIDVIFLQQTKSGKMIGDVKKTLEMALTQTSYKKMLTDGILVGNDLTITPGTQAIRAVVVDRSSGAVGSITIPFSAKNQSSANVTAPPPSSTQLGVWPPP